MSGFHITARDLSIRLGTVASALEVEREDIQLFAAIDDVRFPLTSSNFQVDHDGTLLIDLAAGNPAASVRAQQAVLLERLRQVHVEGFTEEHDDEHFNGELAIAAACYAEEAFCQLSDSDRLPEISQIVPQLWPWEPTWWKPSLDARRNLVKASALILAAIGVIDRAIERELEEPSHD